MPRGVYNRKKVLVRKPPKKVVNIAGSGRAVDTTVAVSNDNTQLVGKLIRENNKLREDVDKLIDEAKKREGKIREAYDESDRLEKVIAAVGKVLEIAGKRN